MGEKGGGEEGRCQPQGGRGRGKGEVEERDGGKEPGVCKRNGVQGWGFLPWENV